jgi:hypothetical protein
MQTLPPALNPPSATSHWVVLPAYARGGEQRPGRFEDRNPQFPRHRSGSTETRAVLRARDHKDPARVNAIRRLTLSPRIPPSQVHPAAHTLWADPRRSMPSARASREPPCHCDAPTRSRPTHRASIATRMAENRCYAIPSRSEAVDQPGSWAGSYVTRHRLIRNHRSVGDHWHRGRCRRRAPRWAPTTEPMRRRLKSFDDTFAHPRNLR